MSWSLPAYEEVARLLGTRTGLTFANRPESAELGMRRAMARAKVKDAGSYLDLLARDEPAFDDLVAELTVGETFFFREPAQFQLLRREVLPDVRRRRGDGHVLRAWSAGCASGEEAYSLAMLFETEGLADRAHVLATDISRLALAKGQRAVYGEWSLRGAMRQAALPFLVPAGATYRIDEKLRRRVAFEYLNLALDVYPSFATGTWGMDVILCRNVLIYFDRETVQRVARRLYQTLAEGGWLLTASSDPPLWEVAPFTPVVVEEGVFYRRAPAAQGVPWLDGAASSIPEAAIEAAVSQEAPGQETVAAAAQAETAGVFSAQASRAGPRDEPTPPADLLEAAQRAFAQGDYRRVVELTDQLEDLAEGAALRVRALANIEAGEAERVCSRAAARHPLSTELHYLHAVLLLDLGRDKEAAQALRRALYLDRSLAIGHFTLGSILQRGGDRAGARRAYRNARDLCLTRPADEAVPLADGERARRLAEAAAAQLTLLELLVSEKGAGPLPDSLGPVPFSGRGK